jgi:hypothetical protein
MRTFIFITTIILLTLGGLAVHSKFITLGEHLIFIVLVMILDNIRNIRNKS